MSDIVTVPASKSTWVARVALISIISWTLWSATAPADSARAKETHALGLEGLGRTALYGIVYDYCIVPKFALGLTYGLGAQVNGTSQVLLPVHGTYYFWGEYLSAFVTMGVLYLPSQNLVYIPGLGLEYRRHGGLLIRVAGYYFFNTFPYLSGTVWPGASLGFAF